MEAYNLEHESIYKHVYDIGDIGIFKWNMDKNELVIHEKITGYQLNSLKNMAEYIKAVAYEKDQMLALHNLNDYIKGKKLLYQSTFRVKTKDGQIKWVLFKGELFKHKKKNDRALSMFMFDVTGNKMYEGHDNLTNLINKRLLEEKLDALIKTNKDKNKNGALIYIDIKNFRALNSKYGFYFGNMVLKRFSQSISNLLENHSELARINGDKFVIVVHKFDTIKALENLCDKIIDSLNNPFEIADKKIYISVSIGLTMFPNDSSDVNELITLSELAVYKSKHNVENTYTFFDRQMYQSYVRENLIKSELKNAIENNELYICYQPQFNSVSQELLGIEALLRWKNNKLGDVSPAEFIPIAEDNGYIEQIGNWVLENALKTACFWKTKGYKFKTIAVNVSPIQLKSNNFKEKLLKIYETYNIPYEMLELELTEGTLLEMTKETVALLYDLKNSGINIAIDDFGTGYSNMCYLLHLPINTIKIDKALIDNVTNEKNKALIRAIIVLFQQLDYKIVAEGAETKEQVEILTSLGCNLIQSYYFSKPLPKKEFELFLKNQKEI